jgi:hypothetical protein
MLLTVSILAMHSSTLCFITLCQLAAQSLCSNACCTQAINSSSSLRVLAVSQEDLPAEGCRKLMAAIAALRNPKAPPSLSCNLTLGTFPVEGLDRVQWLAVQDQDALIMDAWQGLAGTEGLEGDSNQQGLASLAAAADSGAGVPQLPGVGGQSGGLGNQAAAEETAPLLAAAAASSSSRRPASLLVPHTPASAFDVASPVPAGLSAAAAGGGSSSNMAAAWFGAGSSSGSSPFSGAGTSTAVAASGNGSSSSAADLACPMLVFVVTQEDVVKCMVKSPLLFPELDTLDLTGLGIGDEGAAGMAKALEQNPAVRRVVLADNKIGEEGGAALGAALTLNDTLQVGCDWDCKLISELAIS